MPESVAWLINTAGARATAAAGDNNAVCGSDVHNLVQVSDLLRHDSLVYRGHYIWRSLPVRYMWFNLGMGSSSGFEWPLTLDVQALVADGWRPYPFREFIVKVHSRCDLACDYCYMYEMADQSWRDRPRRMPDEIARCTASRIGEHARAHGLTTITLVLHGGEPLLAGRELISDLIRATRKAAGPRVTVDAKIQTNAVGLDEDYLRLFDELDIHVGVSMDGAAEAHDRHRRFRSGRGSFAAVSASVRRLTQERFRHLFSGILCTIDLHNDPIATYESLTAFGPPKIDFLLPHGTWENPPPGRMPGAADTPYADWLIAVFDHWYPSPATRVRLFEDVMHLILGGVSSAEAVGLAPSRMVVVETDGAIEQVDTLKAAYAGAAQTGLHVTTDAFDAAMLLPGVLARQLGMRALAATCRTCRVRQVCGGGQYAHRYRPSTGFANPSVYCPDLMRLIDHICHTMQTDIDARLRRPGNG
ncbi:MAG TPA: FxsB family cyclophane-forming radical SAM/SPASM peptide maturase [Streptosporangiaceae bacterium]